MRAGELAKRVVEKYCRSPESMSMLAESLLEELVSAMREGRRDMIIYEGGVVSLPHPSRLMVVGDLHGDLDTLTTILDNSRALEYLERGQGFYLVFLGDYVDRGPRQAETLALVSYLRLRYPGKVVMLRGNHEPPEHLPPYPHDFPSSLYEAFGEKGRIVYSKWFDVFQALPYSAYVSGLLIMMHGGLPTRNIDEKNFGDYLYAGREPPHWLLEEVLWNDPAEDIEYWVPSPRGAGRLFGPMVTEKVLSRHGFRMVVRGHEPAWSGYKLNHGGRVLTLFSRLGPPYYNAHAAYLLLDFSDKEWDVDIEGHIRTI